MRRIRSLLFTPGNQERKLTRVFEFGSDAVDLDLEDAVPIAGKEIAREMVAKVLDARANMPGPLIVVRVNGPNTGLLDDDLEMVVRPGVFAIHLTKLSDPLQVREIAGSVERLELSRGLDAGSIRFISSVDSAHLALRLPQLVAASPRLFCVVLGGYDFANDIGVPLSDDMSESLWVRSYGVLVSRDAGLAPPLHPPSGRLEDLEHLRLLARAARKLGFQGMVALHPRQVDTIHRVFNPTPEELAWARTVKRSFEEAEAQGRAALSVEGRFIDYAEVRIAERILELLPPEKADGTNG